MAPHVGAVFRPAPGSLSFCSQLQSIGVLHAGAHGYGEAGKGKEGNTKRAKAKNTKRANSFV